MEEAQRDSTTGPLFEKVNGVAGELKDLERNFKKDIQKIVQGRVASANVRKREATNERIRERQQDTTQKLQDARRRLVTGK